MASIRLLPTTFLTLAYIAENWKLQLQSIDIEGVNGKDKGNNE